MNATAPARCFGESACDAARAAFADREGAPLLTCDWVEVLLIHYAIDPQHLQPHVPFELDLFDGKAYVSLVAFTLKDMHVAPRRMGRFGKLLASPLRTHRFLNVRTYVKREGERSIYFISEYVAHRLAVLLGPRTYGLPYQHARSRCEFDAPNGRATGLVRAHAGDGAPASLRYAATFDPEFKTCEPGGLEEFLMERYTALTHRKGISRLFRVWHKPWRIAPAKVNIEDASLLERTFDWFARARMVGAHASPGVEPVWIGRPRRILAEAKRPRSPRRKRRSAWPYLGAAALMLLGIATTGWVAPWVCMFLVLLSLFAACKWLTLAWIENLAAAGWRVVAYCVAHAGMDARAFLDRKRGPDRPRAAEWLQASAKTLIGVMTLIFGVSLANEFAGSIAAAWVGFASLILCVHFGLLHLISLAWRTGGIDARPIMNAPARAKTLSAFWSNGWNTAFSSVANTHIFAPLMRRFGMAPALYATFAVSGLVHELAISLPGGAGWGLPTFYFLLQAAGVLIERSHLGRILGLRSGIRARLFLWLFVLAPMPALFHRPFLQGVMAPMLRAIGVL